MSKIRKANMREKFEGVYTSSREVATISMVPGKKVYDEKLLKGPKGEFRVWNPYRSKLGAALTLDLGNMPFGKRSKVLYLGAGNGTTVSHISDIVRKGLIYCVEFSPRAMTDLYMLSEGRKNIVPILADAYRPQDYMPLIEQVDIVYEDVAQRDQVDILNKNVDTFLKKGGYAFLMVKARSIDVTMEPKRVFQVVEAQLSRKYEILEKIQLDPYEKDHACIVCRLK